MTIVRFSGCLLIMMAVCFAAPKSAIGSTLRAPTAISVSVNGKTASTGTHRAAVSGEFVKTHVLADFGCPSGYRIEQMRMSNS